MPCMESVALVGLATIATASPVLYPEDDLPVLLARQDDVPVNYTNSDGMCETSSFIDGATALHVWNDRGVGSSLDVYLEDSIDPPGKNWVSKLAKFAMGDDAGDLAGDGCGNLDGTCDFGNDLDCPKMVAEGKGAAYWAIRVGVGLQTKMKSLQTRLTTETLSSSLGINEIANDFARPTLNGIADALANALGMVSLAFGFLGTAVPVR